MGSKTKTAKKNESLSLNWGDKKAVAIRMGCPCVIWNTHRKGNAFLAIQASIELLYQVKMAAAPTLPDKYGHGQFF